MEREKGRKGEGKVGGDERDRAGVKSNII